MSSSQPRPPVAWLGLGALGQPMALNVLRAGFALTAYNRSPERLAPLREAGAAIAASAADAVRAAELVLVCLSDDRAVQAVLLPAIEALQPGSLVIDCSTISPATSRQLARQLGERGVGYLDAPVTGGTEGAKAGTLSVLVGGDAQDLERARPVLEVIGQTISHFGAVGAGQEAKAVNQVLVAGSYAAVAEALNLAARLRLPLQPLVEALKTGAAGSWALEHRSGAMIHDHYPLGFRLALHRKDLAIALQAAAAQQLTLPITQRVAAMEDDLISQGQGDCDVSVLARWFRD